MAFDLQRARQETPGTAHVLHFNNAGASLTSQPVLDATIAYLQREAQIGGYEAAAEAHEALEHTSCAVAKLIGATREEIALTTSADEAWNRAFYAIPFKPGDRVLTSKAEYRSNYIIFLQAQQRLGITVEAVPNDEHGQLDVATLRQMIDERVKLISVTHVPTSGGLVNPAAEIGKVAREHGILYQLDACQSVGQMPIDVETLGCDLLSATGRKYLRAPRGTGFLYVRNSAVDQLEPLTLSGFSAEWTSPTTYQVHARAHRFENFESNKAAIVGLGVATDYAMQWGLDVIWQRVSTLARDLRSRLSALSGVLIHDRGPVQCGIVSFTVEGREPAAIQRALKEQHINVTESARKTTLLDLSERGLESVVRASVHYYNSEEEVERFIQAIERLL
ncbi:MAG TPA: aminotransferase class V-fold PLP-dependent enzyme [Ktedonobacteraceae bacterium]|nr:aminotransferase class V-fold PLP-dependent enzyme [Ktedonobacteraceae bacterium]